MTEFKKKLAGVFVVDGILWRRKVRWTSAHPARARLIAERVPDRTEQGRDQPNFLEDAFRESQRACKNFRRSIVEFEHRNKMLSARIHELYDENKELKATIVRAQKAAHEPVDGAERIRELEGEQEKALRGLRALPLVREADLTGFPPLVPNDDADRAENPLGG